MELSLQIGSPQTNRRGLGVERWPNQKQAKHETTLNGAQQIHDALKQEAVALRFAVQLQGVPTPSISAPPPPPKKKRVVSPIAGLNPRQGVPPPKRKHRATLFGCFVPHEVVHGGCGLKGLWELPEKTYTILHPGDRLIFASTEKAVRGLMLP